MSLISIIVPIYNGEKYLKKCLNSILRQTYKNIEVILINDGSIDKSNQICKEYIKLDDRIIYIEQKNKGVSGARNKGIEVANGDFVLFVDVDDYMQPNMIEELYNKAKKYNSDIVISNYHIVEKSNIIRNEYNMEKVNITSNEFIKYMLNEEFYRGFLWNKLINRRIIANCRFDENIHIMEDLVFLLEISKNINSVYVLKDEYLYFYVQHDLSALHKKTIKQMSNCLAYEKIVDYIIENNIKLLDDDYCYYIWNYVYTFMCNYCYMNAKGILINEYKQKRKNDIKKMLKKALKRKISIIDKIKLIILFYFPNLYYMLKQRKVQ